MSTTVLLEVMPKLPIDPDHYLGHVPADIAAALADVGQSCQASLSGRVGGPCLMRFQLSGEDRVEHGRQLETRLRNLGYDANVSFWP